MRGRLPTFWAVPLAMLYASTATPATKPVNPDDLATPVATQHLFLLAQNSDTPEEHKDLGSAIADVLGAAMDRAHENAQARADAVERFQSLTKAALEAFKRGDIVDAQEGLQRAIDMAPTMGNRGAELGPIYESLVALCIEAEGRINDAETLLRKTLAGASGAMPKARVVLLNALALNLIEQGRGDEGIKAATEAVEINHSSWRNPQMESESHLALGGAYMLIGDLAKSDDEYRQAMAQAERHHLEILPDALGQLAQLDVINKKYIEAEKLAERAVSITEKRKGVNLISIGIVLQRLGGVQNETKKFDEASANLELSVKDLNQSGFAGGRIAHISEAYLATARAGQGRFAEAMPLFRSSCAALTQTPSAANRSAGAAKTVPGGDGVLCNISFVDALWNSAQSDPNLEASARAEAFVAAQSALNTVAGSALAQSAAKTAAMAKGAGPAARAYEKALAERDGFSEFVTGTNATPEQAAALQAKLSAVDVAVTKSENELLRTYPNYAEFRAPKPIPFDQLQYNPQSSHNIMNKNEALVVFVTLPHAPYGFVFAASPKGLAWQKLDWSSDELEARVETIRASMDRNGYKLAHTSGIAGNGASSHFDRHLAAEVYAELFGGSKVAETIRGASTLLIVPSGVLAALPFSALVTSPASETPAVAASQEDLRKTAWLLRGVATGILPSVSALRALRQRAPRSAATGRTPLFAIADPDFAGTETDDGERGTPITGFNALFAQGRLRPGVTALFPRLPGTRIEANRLAIVLHASNDSVIMGARATESEIKRRSDDGRLAKARVIELATHAIAGGESLGVAEPAIILAKPPDGADSAVDDGALTASEAAQLNLDADWVVLSACNTASPDAPESQGLSGFSRSFLYAGARRLLISQWSLRDDVASVMVPRVLQLAEQGTAPVEALRVAALAILDDSALHAAAPQAWAAFELVGDPGGATNNAPSSSGGPRAHRSKHLRH